MIVERTENEMPALVNTKDLQDFLNYERYKELTSNFNFDQKEADKLSDEINTYW